MITVKMLLPLLKEAEKVNLVWCGYLKKFDPEDELDVDAYGSYVVDRIHNVEKNEYELHIAFRPLKAAEN